jgi:UDP-N-acetylmuramoyl-L-alanyl-D-glutamate--2,6-diaminopimelate ligase
MRKFVPKFVFSIYHFLWAFWGAVIYNFPSKKMIVIGVTGTDGKTTVVHLITKILALQLRGKVASISSIRFKIGNKEWKNTLRMTMPGRLKLQKFLKQAFLANCKYVVLEVTSEGAKQYRHKFIDFNGIVFTNLTKEHIEAHGGFENYKKAKGKIFKALRESGKKDKFIIVNVDDKHNEYFVKLAGKVKKYEYSLKDSIKTPLLGEFNKYNALAALNVALALGVEKENALRAIEAFKGISGRMEEAIKEPFRVIVDYAHTFDALEKVYKTLGKDLICVFGSCGGGRDRWKRPEIGKIASNYCKRIILTNEDPYDENPNRILSDIESGIPKSKLQISKQIIDRREAINKALSIAKKGDTVIITGKGSEPSICVANNKKIPWSDKEVVLEEFKKIYAP